MVSRISCSSTSNFSSYQREKILRRVKLMKDCLLIASKLQMRFRYIKHLASYVANYIEEVEFNESKDRALAAGVSHSGLPQKVDAGTFTRSVHYKAVLNEWMQHHSMVGVVKTSEKNGVNEFRVQIADLSNEVSWLRHELAKRAVAHEERDEASYASKTKINPNLTEAYFMVAALLEEFSDFVEVHDGALVVANSLRKVLIDEGRFKSYQLWRKDFIEMRRPKLQ